MLRRLGRQGRFRRARHFRNVQWVRGVRRAGYVRQVRRFGGKGWLLRHAYKDSLAKSPLQRFLCNHFFGVCFPAPAGQSCFTNPSDVIQSSATSCGSWPWTSTFAFRSCATVLFSFFVTGSMTSAICGYFFRALELITGAAL